MRAPESGRRGAVLLIGLFVVAALAMPAASFAGTAATDGVNVSYVANAGETNNVTVDLSAGTYTITDTGTNVTFTAGAGCTLVSPTTASCPQPADPGDPFVAADHVIVYGEDQDDVIRINAAPRDGTRIVGGPGNDTIIGSPGADKISGGPGADVIDPTDVGVVDLDIFNSFEPCDLEPISTESRMYHCPDLIDGDSGFNTLRFDSKPGGVIIDAGPRGPLGTAVIDPTRDQNGDAQANVLVKGIRGAFRTAQLIGTPNNDQIYGSINSDNMVGRGGADVLCGGPGSDTADYTASGSSVNVSLDSNLPADTKWESTDRQEWTKARGDCRQTDNFGQVLPAAEKDCIANDGVAGESDCVGVDVENVLGSNFDDTLTGNGPGAHVDKAAFFEPRGSNRLEGRGGNDLLDGATGADALIGGDGTDTVTYASRTAAVKVSLDGAANDGGAADVNPDSGLADSVGPDIENLIGGLGDDVLVGSAASNTLLGGDGSDTLQGEGGDDVVDGQAGHDEVPVTFEPKLFGGPGNDTVRGGPGSDTLDGGSGADSLDGGEDEDAVDYSNYTTDVVASADDVANDGSAIDGQGDNVSSSVEDIWGGSSNDTLAGNGGPGVLDGGAGDDRLDGGGGPDDLVGGSGIDTANYSSRSAPVAVDLAVAGGAGEAGEADLLDGIEAVAGGSGDDVLTGDDALNILSGGPGNDMLTGRGGDDQVFGGDGNDTELGSAGGDKLAGDGGNDNLQGEDDADILNGGGGDDQLDGGGAADILSGDSGNDTALYASRTAAVSVTFDGADNDGQANERDQVRLTTESTKTGSGGDTIDARDGIKGNIACGAGNDSVLADLDDEVANDCEDKRLLASALCTVGPSLVNMSKKGTISIKVRCPRAGKGTLKLRSVGRAKRAKKLGSKSISVKAGKKKTVKIKLTKTAKRLLKRHKGSLRTHATVSVKAATSARNTKRSQNLTILAPRWRR